MVEAEVCLGALEVGLDLATATTNTRSYAITGFMAFKEPLF
jgi:hypothetical protein